MESPQVGTMNDRKDDAEMQSADGAVAAAKPEGRNKAFKHGMGKGEYNTGMGKGEY